jgi:hypothetical protein
MGVSVVVRAFILSVLLFLSGCISLVAPYDATFDQSLNKLSEDTATFLAAASAGGSERNYSSKESVAYYAATYDVLGRLIARAEPIRGSIPCKSAAGLEAVLVSPVSKTELPENYREFDCLEVQLYSLRFLVDRLQFSHASNGILTQGEATEAAHALQSGFIGTIAEFLKTKPA